ncbi:high frequency lysogenization protein HflD [Balneatrix alpica]|uniref:High frequency lysogenization protein HflD homolog n=1 Tax=Balneatrix alpica TaxID=75684 RepID=A0ABV5Z7D5_9GAMM|nr:high frequency lysogenization protein HflD [Balneatrix alpica]
MATPYLQQAMALAAVLQAARLVDDIAKRAHLSTTPFEASISSLFMLQPQQPEDVYGGRDALNYNLSLGLRELKAMLEKDSQQSRDVIRYALSLILLERKLDKSPAMLQKLGERMPEIERQASFFADQADPESCPYLHTNVIAALAGLYQDTLSTFSFRIHVSGNPIHLRDNDNVNRIRAVLLAGIRAARHWRQLGGRRWQLLLSRGRLLQACEQLQHG